MAQKPNFTHHKNPVGFSLDDSPAQKSNRVARVAEIIRHALADTLLRTHFRHPDLADSHLITVSEVSLSPDLKNAHVMVYPLFHKNEPPVTSNAAPLETTVRALNKASGFLRTLLAKKMTQRTVPTLKFYIDTRFDHASKIEAILLTEKNDV